MPPYYDIYALSLRRDEATINKFLDTYAYRDKIEDQAGQEISVSVDDADAAADLNVNINTLTEVIDLGLNNMDMGFVFYIGDHLKSGIDHIVLKFTYDRKMIFGISLEEKVMDGAGVLVDNYPKAMELEQAIAALTHAVKTSIQFEYPPADDEPEFDEGMLLWAEMNAERRGRYK